VKFDRKIGLAAICAKLRITDYIHKEIQMKKIIIMLSAILITTATYADTNKPILNNIIYRVTSQTWVKTNTAKVIVAINATVKNKDIAEVRNDMMQKLQNMAPKAKWNVTQFMRSQNPSGLEQIYLSAQSRVPENVAADIRNKAKAASTAGQKFQVVKIDYTPSMQAVQQSYAKLRDNIYQQANEELKRLNKVYPQQQYFLHQVNFGNAAPIYRMANLKMGGAYIATNKAQQVPMKVARQLTLTATVVLSANLNDNNK
jgi:hypothetical protein